MINKILMFFVNLMQKYLPDPFVIAWLLTLIVCGLALILTPAGPLDIVDYWGGRFFGIMQFAMQMVLLLVSGYALATAPLVHKFLGKLVSVAKTPRQLVLLVGLTAMVLYYCNWGLGLVAGAFLAKEAGRRNPEVDMRTLVAAGYAGIILTNGGLSASVALLINTPGHFLEKQMGLIPLSETIFQLQTIVIVVLLAITLPLACAFLLPSRNNPSASIPAF